MGRLFNLDGKVYKFLDRIANCMIVSILWTIFSLPLFTVGASTTALYHTIHKVIINDTGHILQEFWRAFKSNFKQSTIVWLLLLLILVFLGTDCYFAYILSQTNTVLQWILVALIVISAFVIVWSVYCFAYIAHIQDPTKTVLKNTCIMCILNLSKSLMLLGGFCLAAAMIILFPFSAVFLIILPGAYMYFAHSVLKKVFSQYWDMEAVPPEME